MILVVFYTLNNFILGALTRTSTQIKNPGTGGSSSAAVALQSFLPCPFPWLHPAPSAGNWDLTRAGCQRGKHLSTTGQGISAVAPAASRI